MGAGAGLEPATCAVLDPVRHSKPLRTVLFPQLKRMIGQSPSSIPSTRVQAVPLCFRYHRRYQNPLFTCAHWPAALTGWWPA